VPVLAVSLPWAKPLGQAQGPGFVNHPHHRYSEDVDLFTLDDEAFTLVLDSLPAIATALGGTHEERVATIHFRQVFIRVSGQPELKLDLVREVGPQFGEPQRFGDIIVDSLLNIFTPLAE